ncbi:hypothetical protein [Lactococcus petauri]|uniref:hypothetical protein n=1 Tax=Lactococcus petauri TaxID=1940789 RepID=UPI0022E32307|nr:hypothetical protein [Lactococcus petauri]
MKKANKRASKITYLFVCGFVLLSFSLAGPRAQTVSEAAEIMNPLSPDDNVIPQEPEPITVPPASEEEKAQTPPKSLKHKVTEKKKDRKSKKKRRKSFLHQTQQLHLNNHKKLES